MYDGNSGTNRFWFELERGSSYRESTVYLLPCNRTKDKMHAREILLSKHFLSEIKYYFNLYEFLKRRIHHALVGKLKNRCFCWFPATIFVLMKGASIHGASIQSFIKLGKTLFGISRISLRASSPIWASGASLARTPCERRAFSRGSLRLLK